MEMKFCIFAGFLLINNCFFFRMGFSEFAAKNSKDPRFKLIEKMKEREVLFNEFISETKKKKAEEVRNRAEKVWLGVLFQLFWVGWARWG